MLARGGTAIFSTSPWQALDPYVVADPSALFAVNLESPFGKFPAGLDSTDASMNLCADASEVELLIKGEIDLVTTGNNHGEDCSNSDAGDQKQLLQTAGIEVVPIGEVVIKRVGKQSVAFLAYDDYSGDGDLAGLLDGIRSAQESSDLVVVSIHWGSEYQAGPTSEQEELAQKLVDAGADLLWGQHPHVLQRMEWRESLVDGHTALVMYSLGNLLADQWMLPDAMRSALVRIEFEQHEFKRISILPLHMDAASQVLQPVIGNATAALITDRLGLVELERDNVPVEIWVSE